MTLGGNKVFLDTNIWVYAADASDLTKMVAARQLVNRVRLENRIVVSVQSLGEFCNVTTRMYKRDFSKVWTALKMLEGFEVVSADAETIAFALDIAEKHKIAFWDAMLVATASEAGCTTLYSEDLNHNQVISGVKIMNPFIEE